VCVPTGERFRFDDRCLDLDHETGLCDTAALGIAVYHSRAEAKQISDVDGKLKRDFSDGMKHGIVT